MEVLKMKQRVLHVIKSLGRGGAEMLLPETVKLHDRESFEFHCIYFLPWKDQLVPDLLANGCTVTCLSATSNVRLLLKAKALAEYVRANDIDLIHAHLPFAGIVSRIAGKLAGVPVVYTEHNKQERYHKITYFLNKATFNFQSRVIAVSDDVKESIMKNIGPRIPVQTILNGVNTAEFNRDHDAGKALRQEYGIPADAVVIGTIAVFRFQKRLAEWLSVLSEVCRANPNVYGVIVGDGPLRSEIHAKAAQLDLGPRLVMPGLQTDVKPWLSAMDVYMMSSIFEGLPIALLEAMSMECAIVATNAGGIKEVIRDGVDGLVTDVGSWERLTEHVTTLLNPSVRNRFASAGRRRVVESFSLQRMVDELEQMYRQVIANPS